MVVYALTQMLRIEKYVCCTERSMDADDNPDQDDLA